VVGVQVGQKDNVDVCQRELTFPETHERTRPGIHEDSGYGIDENELARGRAAGGSRTTRP